MVTSCVSGYDHRNVVYPLLSLPSLWTVELPGTQGAKGRGAGRAVP